MPKQTYKNVKKGKKSVQKEQDKGKEVSERCIYRERNKGREG
jgi:hypothetical protein